MNMSIGLVPVSAKPFHRGHFLLIQKASKENDTVIVFVSTSDRARKGEITISGQKMLQIWRTQIEPILPANVTVEYVQVPIRSVWETLGTANENQAPEIFKIYGDPADLAERFPEKSLIKYAGYLYENEQIILRPIERGLTDNISGTAMRRALQTGDFEAFAAGLPPGMEADVVWQMLQ